jgi:hypothetical protein
MCRMSWKSGNLKLLEPSGPHRACNGTSLPFFAVFERRCRYLRLCSVEWLDDRGFHPRGSYVPVRSTFAPLEIEYSCGQQCIYRRDSSWNANSSTLEPDRSQRDHFHACVIAQQSSSSPSCVRFNSCKLKCSERLKTLLFYFLKHWASLKLRSLHWIRKINSRYFRGGEIRNISLIHAHRPGFERITAHHELKLGKLPVEPTCPVVCEQNNVLVIACLCGWPSNCWHCDSSQFCLLAALASWMLNPSFFGEKTSDRMARHFISMFESCLSLV